MIIISGGQIGADLAGLEFGYISGFKTGGVAPKDWRTNIGPNLDLRDKYKLTESKISSYKHRTWENVRLSTATVRLCVDFFSSGEICTLNAIQNYNRPYFDVYLPNPASPQYFSNWLRHFNVEILNVAGNTQGKHGFNIYQMSLEYLIQTFSYFNSAENK